MKKIFISFILLIFCISCKPIIIKSKTNYIKDNYSFTNKKLSSEKKISKAVVDYNNENNSVFFSLKTGKIFSVKNNCWDLAIITDNGNIFVVTNSGDYGENTRLLPFKKGSSETDYLNGANGFTIKKIQQVSFKKGRKELSPYQNDPDTAEPIANPIYNALENEKRYFLKVGKTIDKAKVFIIWFSKITSPSIGSNFTLNLKSCTFDMNSQHLTSINPSVHTITGSISDSYSFNFIKLNKIGGKILNKTDDGIPEKEDWDLLFTRTNIYSKEMGEVFGTDGIIGTSSILINKYANVEAAPLYGWDFPEVKFVPEAKYFKKDIDTIGHGYSNPLENDENKTRKAWYYSLTMPPTFYLSRITYVIKCTDGNYGKFRPGSFYGPKGEKFYVRFRYAY